MMAEHVQGHEPTWEELASRTRQFLIELQDRHGDGSAVDVLIYEEGAARGYHCGTLDTRGPLTLVAEPGRPVRRWLSPGAAALYLAALALDGRGTGDAPMH